MERTRALTLTDEQMAAVQMAQEMKPNQVMKINACAGAGKTALLLAIAAANPDKRFLYLAFNRDIAQEIKNKAPKNVVPMTTHGLAYREMGVKQCKGGSYKTDELMDYLGVTRDYLSRRDFIAAFRNFLLSAEIDPPEAIEPGVKRLVALASAGQIPWIHDLYLKEYTRRLCYGEKTLDKYDYILLDEAQDTNPAVYVLFQLATARKIMVGDINQNIYSFRNTINILANKADYECHLTKCFRCEQEHLTKAENMLRYYKHPVDKLESGFKPDGDQSIAILCRTNRSIFEVFEKAMKAGTDCNLKLERDPKEFLSSPVDLLHYVSGNPVSSYVSYNARTGKAAKKEELDKYCQRLGVSDICDYIECGDCFDIDLEADYALVVEMGVRIFDIYEGLCRNWDDKSRYAERVTITTGHKAKGREWGQVIIYKDFDIESIDRRLAKNIISVEARNWPKQRKERRKAELFQKAKIDKENEVNLYYVALTRAKMACHDFSYNGMDCNGYKVPGFEEFNEPQEADRVIQSLIGWGDNAAADAVEAKQEQAPCPASDDSAAIEMLLKRVADLEKEVATLKAMVLDPGLLELALKIVSQKDKQGAFHEK